MRLLLLRLLFLGLCLSVAHAEWTTLKDCELVPNAYGDGDSFHVHSGSQEMIARLYFVDTPETDDAFPERVKTQAEYFGLSVPETLKLGKKAEEFTKRTLAGRFTVVTQHQDARGRSREPRYYSYVLLNEGKRSLAALLVENGLARVFGMGTRSPEGVPEEAQWQELRRLEAKAKAQKVGGWGGKTLPAEASGRGGQTSRGILPQEDFFKHARVAVAAKPTVTPVKTVPQVVVPRVTTLVQTPTATPDTGPKLDLNSATAAELAALPLVSGKMAERIVAKRPFTTVADLWNVEGMTEKIYAELETSVRVGK